MMRARLANVVSCSALETIVISAASLAVYFVVFGAQFFLKELIPGGDTQTLWSLHYLAVYSLTHFGEFLWWDPTALNGWPAYYLTHHGWFSLMSPFQLAQLLFGVLLSWVFGMSINTVLLLQKTVLTVAINIVGVALVSRELIRERPARLLPPLTYALCHMQFMGYAASGIVEALPPALFLLWSIVRYNDRRTPESFNLLVLFVGIYLGSISYVSLQSHFYAFFFFVVLLPYLFPGFVSSLRRNVVAVYRSPWGRTCLAVGLLFAGSGLAAFLSGVAPNLPRLARARSGTVPFDMTATNQFDPPNYAISSLEAWSTLFSWIPYSDFHAYSMRMDPYTAGLDYRYIGLATLPLIAIALTRAVGNRYVLLLGLPFFLCSAFIVYTWQNLPFSLLVSETSLFKNIRTMALVMPRDLVGLFPIFIAGIGLDRVLADRPDTAAYRTDGTRRLASGVLSALMVLGVACLALLALVPGLYAVRKSLGHIGIYLPLFAGLALLMLSVPETTHKRPIAWAFVLLAFADLTISASDQWLNNNVNGRYVLGRNTIAFSAEQRGIGPLTTEDNSWAGQSYNGMVHNMVHGGPYFGLKEWLTLVTRRAWQPVLDTWNAETRMVTRYPHFKFFTNGTYVGHKAVEHIESIEPPAIELPDALVTVDGRAAIRLDGRLYLIEAGLPGFVERAQLGWADRYRFSGWAVDRDAGRPASRVLLFVGNRLAYVGSPSIARPDVAGGNPKLLMSGFSFNVENIPNEARNGKTSVRVFAVMQNGTAAELRYAEEYPFSTDFRLDPPNAASRSLSGASGKPAFYLHKARLVRAGEPGRRLYDADYEVLKFSVNRVKVRARLPEPAWMLSLDNYDRFWTARVNGKPTRVYRANFTFKAIMLPAGDSIVEWRYNPYPTKIAWALYYTLLAAFLSVLVAWHRRPRVSSPSCETPQASANAD